MTHGTLKFAAAPTADRWQIMHRAEALRAEESRRLLSALSRRIRSAFAAVAKRGVAIEQVYIPRNTSSAIF